MGNSDQIAVHSEEFKVAAENFSTLINEFKAVYNKIVSSNANLAAACEGDAANKFREQATIVENVFFKNIESLNIILEVKLEFALNEFKNEDNAIALMFRDPLPIKPESKNIQTSPFKDPLPIKP